MIAAAPPALVKEADPVGEYPLTVAVHVVDVPTCTGEGTQPTETVDVAWVTVNVVVPELPELPCCAA